MNNSTDFCDILRRPADAVAFVKGKARFSTVDGTVRFYQLRSSVVVRAEIEGLPKGCCCNSPIFAFHIHDGEECSGNILDAFADADGHFNPDNCRHPYHAGDMPPLFGADGKAVLIFLTDRFSVKEILGKTVIIHSLPDDFRTQPAGLSGEKIACGVITPSQR
ncbi:MAG: superoxide dismutase family protein [Oscillospiraceae bacterium]